jgi:hypothetical protein
LRTAVSRRSARPSNAPAVARASSGSYFTVSSPLSKSEGDYNNIDRSCSCLDPVSAKIADPVKLNK